VVGLSDGGGQLENPKSSTSVESPSGKDAPGGGTLAEKKQVFRFAQDDNLKNPDDNLKRWFEWEGVVEQREDGWH
jgi:hypothetical protein